MSGTALVREHAGTSDRLVEVVGASSALLQHLRTNLCPVSASIEQLVQDAASAGTVRQQEAEHAFDMDRITSTLSNLSDNVWGPVQLQRIVACCDFLHAHELVECTPPQAGVNDLAMAVRTRSVATHCRQHEWGHAGVAIVVYLAPRTDMHPTLITALHVGTGGYCRPLTPY
jgi:hypothetical protein